MGSTNTRDLSVDIAVLEAFRRGENNAVIGRKLGVSRERVRQRLLRLGLRSRRIGGAARFSAKPEHTQEQEHG